MMTGDDGSPVIDDGYRLLTVDFTERTRSERLGAEIQRILDTKALRQASNLELLR